MRRSSSWSGASPPLAAEATGRPTPATPCSRPTPACSVECRKCRRPWRRDSSLDWVSLSSAWLRSGVVLFSSDERVMSAATSFMAPVWQQSLMKLVKRLAAEDRGSTVTHTHTRTHTHAFTHTRTHTHAFTHTRTHTHACTHTRTHTHAFTHTRTHTHMHTHTYTHTHAHTHVHTRTCTHTRTHTRMHTHTYTQWGIGGMLHAKHPTCDPLERGSHFGSDGPYRGQQRSQVTMVTVVNDNLLCQMGPDG